MMIPLGRDARRRSTALQQSDPRQASIPTSPRPSGWRMALRKKAKANPTGFTLVELMIVVAIIGLLAAVAIPQFLNARNRADAKAKVGELVGIAKECATFNAEADESTTTIQEPTGGEIACGGANPEPRTLASRAFAAQTTVDCLGTTIDGDEFTQVTITVTQAGQMSCSKTMPANS